MALALVRTGCDVTFWNRDRTGYIAPGLIRRSPTLVSETGWQAHRQRGATREAWRDAVSSSKLTRGMPADDCARSVLIRPDYGGAHLG